MDKILSLSLLGLAYRAGALAFGTRGALEKIRRRQAFLVIVASDASPNTKKDLTDKCTFYGVECEFSPYSMEEIGKALGKPPTACAAICDRGFVKTYKTKTKRQT
ncbi:MAG: ribosomal L7Ae/L30e/S12e/Gadd45 family protein [Eubacteriales bacterium]